MTPDLSIVIPVYNRGELIRYTLESVRRATVGLNIELIVVDDGSNPPAADSLRHLGYAPTQIIRQDNQGLLFARLRGLSAVTGRYTLFLDSDDLVSRDKLALQVRAQDAASAEISYTDTARAVLEGSFDSLGILPDSAALATTAIAEFFISVQPPPHSPVWRTDFLHRTVAEAFIAPSPLYNSVAEIWFYHNAAILPGRVVKVAGPHTIVGQHPGARLTNHWERLGLASLAVMEAFARRCPDTPAAAPARQLVAEKAFRSWRRLPRGFSAEYNARLLGIWRRLHREVRLAWLGGGLFQKLARLAGPVGAAHLLRLRNGGYRECRTMDDDEFTRAFMKLPPP